jgi:uncharacterized protein YicC (UPF0701 family)
VIDITNLTINIKRKNGDAMAINKILTAKELIDKRKELWSSNKDTDLDKQFTWAVAEKICSDTKQGESLREEIKNHPEYLIELCFTVVNKLQETMPFFLNEVQYKLCNKLNQALDEYKEGKRHHLKFLVLKGRQARLHYIYNRIPTS